jgi:hypothetical protein
VIERAPRSRRGTPKSSTVTEGGRVTGSQGGGWWVIGDGARLELRIVMAPASDARLMIEQLAKPQGVGVRVMG